MASIILETVLGEVGAAIGGSSLLGGSAVGSIFGEAIGGVVGLNVGDTIDSMILPRRKHRTKGGRLSDLSVQSSAYGRMIPIAYGTTRMSGNVIWSQPIKETVNTRTTTSGGKGGDTVKTKETSYSYSITMAIAICEGEIDEVLRVWADAKAIDPADFSNSYSLYKGTETQLPDSVIEGFEGAGNIPAHRGTAYVVIEDFPLGEFGNRIPNFTFEIKKKELAANIAEETAEDLVKSIIMIPGSGEAVYDTVVQSKVSGEQVGNIWAQGINRSRINQNNRENKADALVALDQLEETLPNLQWIGVVVTWFGDDLDAGVCTIKPGVEYQAGAQTDPDAWQVGSFSRSTARQITLDADGNPVYGGTPSDAGLLRYLDELKARGFNIMFYPMFFMDTTNKPWRGRVTGSAADVASFFTKTDGYNDFVNHYATLVKDKVDAFVIGSELIGLTSVQDVDNSFPAVDELVNLAAAVKATVGSVKVTYAADWSEYHHDANGWYNLDPLWSSSNIDVVGIDAYFPLTDEVQNGYNEQSVINGWTSGEGFDWYYTDPQRTTKSNLEAKYAWKNIDWWWKNSHINPDTNATAWVPQSKKIWFTEYGFPSVDGATNQPNVFYDPNSSESSLPRFSKGRIDFRAQRLGITATENQWKNSAMVERMFLWTWDARPFPYWPDLKTVWTDGSLWKTGHWIQGKLGLSNLGAIVADLSRKSGLKDSEFDVTMLNDLVNGYIVGGQTTAKNSIENLKSAYFFDSVESDGLIKFIQRGGAVIAQIPENDLVPNVKTGERFVVSRTHELELPQKVDVTYINKSFDYLIGDQHSQRLAVNSNEQSTLNLPIVLSDQEAKNIADKTLFNAWTERTAYKFELPEKYAYLEPTDIVELTKGNVVHKMRIVSASATKAGIISITAVAEDISVYDFYTEPSESTFVQKVVKTVSDTKLEILDLPPLPADDGVNGVLRFALTGLESSWKGAVVYRSDDSGVSYSQIAGAGEAAIIGTATTILADGVTSVFDDVNKITVLIMSGELESVTEIAVLNGANVAKIGNEIIQFKSATLISSGKYELGGLLRGRAGTEKETANHVAEETFILLDSRVAKISMANGLIGLLRKYKGVSVGGTLGSTASQDFTYQANGLKPLSPVHITGNRDGSSNLTISWIRRTRIGGDWRDGVDVPIGEESEAYEVDIMNGANVVRTISGLSSQTATYSAAEQTADFGSIQSNVSAKIYQISSIVGRGDAGVI